MPRAARLKSPNGMYHVMFRSQSEFDLYRDEDDKIKYLALLKKYQYKYGFALYSYCLMNNHGHLLIDTLGADISKIMHVVNFCYAQYYNQKYKRGGSVFRDRFNAKAVNSEKYFITLSAYIHNNPKDIQGYRDNVAAYPFSSLKEYLADTDTYGILNTKFLKELLHLNHSKNKQKYLELIGISNLEEFEHDFEFINPETDYRSERRIIIKHTDPKKIIAYVAKYLNQDPLGIHLRYNKSYTKLRALNCFLMSCFSNIKQREICEIMGNITQSRVSKLSLMGLEFVLKDKKMLEECLIL